MTSDDEGAAILAAVLDEPGDDLPRLAYADWLEDDGQPERAEFIRRHIANAKLRCKPSFAHNMNTCPKCAENDRLWEMTRSEWAGGFKGQGKWMRGEDVFTFDDGRTIRVSRGFVARVELPLADFLAHAAALLRAHPIEEVRLTDRFPAFQPSQAWEWYAEDPECACDHELPRPLFDLLSPGRLVGKRTSAYGSEADALADASQALVAFGVSLRRR